MALPGLAPALVGPSIHLHAILDFALYSLDVTSSFSSPSWVFGAYQAHTGDNRIALSKQAMKCGSHGGPPPLNCKTKAAEECRLGLQPIMGGGVLTGNDITFPQKSDHIDPMGRYFDVSADRNAAEFRRILGFV